MSDERRLSQGRDRAHGWSMFVLFTAAMAAGAMVVFFIVMTI